MYFQPAIPIGGYGGWQVLQKTSARQQEVFEKSPGLARDIEYFLENIEKADTPAKLVADRRLLTVALGAFGLGDEINKRAFIERALESDTEDRESFVNRLSEPRYKEMAKAFGYGDITAGTNVILDSFKEKIVARFKEMEFERSVGDVDEDMRLAMNFKREIRKIAAGENAEKAGWLQAMGQLPVRKVLFKALGVPEVASKLDIDKQKELLERKAEAMFGTKSIEHLDDPEVVDGLIRRYFLFRQMENGPSALTPGAAALTLLQSSGFSGTSAANLLLSQR